MIRPFSDSPVRQTLASYSSLWKGLTLLDRVLIISESIIRGMEEVKHCLSSADGWSGRSELWSVKCIVDSSVSIGRITDQAIILLIPACNTPFSRLGRRLDNKRGSGSMAPHAMHVMTCDSRVEWTNPRE